MVPPAATLSTICTCARAPVPPIPRIAMYRPVRAGKPQAEARPARFPPPGYNPRASTTGPDSPHARHAQARNQDSKPVHLPPTPDAPSTYFSQARATGQRREPRDPLHQAQAHPIAPGQQENDTTQRAVQRASSPRSGGSVRGARSTCSVAEEQSRSRRSRAGAAVAVRHYQWPLLPRALPLT